MEAVFTHIITKEKVDLCRNCLHTFNCSYKSSHSYSVNQCEEHEEERSNIENSHSDGGIDKSKTFTSLCQNCEHVKHCSLKENQSVVLVCEHYE